MTPYPALVIWDDAQWFADTWETERQARKKYTRKSLTKTAKLAHTVGWVYAETEDHVLITDTRYDGTIGATTRLPRGIIREIRRLK